MSPIGVPVRVHSLEGDDLGIAHLPPPVEIGDMIALPHAELRVYDVVPFPPDALITALVKSQPARLRLIPR